MVAVVTVVMDRVEIKKPRQMVRFLYLALDDDLLSHGAAPHYHRRCIVSLLSSEWDQVVPMLYGRQAIRCYAVVSPHGVKGGKSDSVWTRGNCNLVQFQTVVQCVKP